MGWHKQAKHNRLFDTKRWVHHAGSWVGELARGELILAQGCAGHRAVRVALCISRFVLYILLTNITVVTVLLICCSVKMSLSWPTSFVFFFHSPPHPSRGLEDGGGGNGAIAWCFVDGQGQTTTTVPNFFRLIFWRKQMLFGTGISFLNFLNLPGYEKLFYAAPVKDTLHFYITSKAKCDLTHINTFLEYSN